MRVRLFIALLATPMAWGGFLVYTSSSDWLSSSPGNTNILDFSSVTPAYYSSFSYSPYAFQASSGGLFVLPGANAGTGSGTYLTTDLATVLNITLGAGVYGIAFNLGANASTAVTGTVIISGTNGIQLFSTAVTTSGSPGPATFWGLRSDVPLAGVKISFTTNNPQLDNLQYSNTALPSQGGSAPEPAPWALLAAGGVALLLVCRPLTSKSARSSRPGERRTTANDWRRRNK